MPPKVRRTENSTGRCSMNWRYSDEPGMAQDWRSQELLWREMARSTAYHLAIFRDFHNNSIKALQRDVPCSKRADFASFWVSSSKWLHGLLLLWHFWALNLVTGDCAISLIISSSLSPVTLRLQFSALPKIYIYIYLASWVMVNLIEIFFRSFLLCGYCSHSYVCPSKATLPRPECGNALLKQKTSGCWLGWVWFFNSSLSSSGTAFLHFCSFWDRATGRLNQCDPRA